MQTIGERIRYIRKEKLNKSQTDFGESIGLKANSLSDIEKGKNNITEQNIKAICREYNVDREWLVNGIGDDPFIPIPEDDYMEIATIIGEKDQKAKQAIIDYWNLKESDKKLFWNFLERFLK